MANFLWSGKTPSGQEEAEEVTAETPAEARKILEARGWTELRQHTTDVADFIHQRQSLISRKRRELTPNEKLQYRQGTAPGFWTNWLKNINKDAVALLVLAGIATWIQYNRQVPHPGLWIVTLAVFLAFLVFRYPVQHWWFGRTKRLWVKMHKAKTWHRWDEVLQCLDKLVKSQQATHIGINDYTTARYRALALTGLGRLDDALTGFRVAAEKANTPPEFYHSSLAGLYSTAGQYDKALECYRAAVDQATDKALFLIDVGMYLVSRFNRPQEARQLLAQAEKMQLSESAITHLSLVRGMIAFREKDLVAVDKHMREALANLEKRPRNKRYIYERSILICKSYLAVSSAALGRKSEGRKYFAQTKKYLELIKQKDVIQEYENWINRSS